MPDRYGLIAVLKVLVLPPTGPLLIALLGVFLLSRHPRTGRAFAALGTLALLVLSIPIVAFLLLRFVDTAAPLDLREAERAQAIVVLGGGTRADAIEYSGDTLGRLTLERVRYGARVAPFTPVNCSCQAGVNGCESSS